MALQGTCLCMCAAYALWNIGMAIQVFVHVITGHTVIIIMSDLQLQLTLLTRNCNYKILTFLTPTVYANITLYCNLTVLYSPFCVASIYIILHYHCICVYIGKCQLCGFKSGTRTTCRFPQ